MPATVEGEGENHWLRVEARKLVEHGLALALFATSGIAGRDDASSGSLSCCRSPHAWFASHIHERAKSKKQHHKSLILDKQRAQNHHQLKVERAFYATINTQLVSQWHARMSSHFAAFPENCAT